MPYLKRRRYRRLRRRFFGRRRLSSYRRSRIYKRSRYGMRGRSGRRYSRRSRGLGSVITPRVAGFGNKKTVVFRGYQSQYLNASQTSLNTLWSPLTVDSNGKNRFHPLWFWDPFNQFDTDNRNILLNGFDGLGLYQKNYHSAITQSVYYKIKFTNNHDSGTIQFMAGMTDAYTVLDQIPDDARVLGAGNNFRMVSVGPGKSRTIRYKLKPQQWARMRHENATNTRIQMTGGAYALRDTYSVPVYDIFFQIWYRNPNLDTNITMNVFNIDMWQYSRVNFFNRRGVTLIEHGEEELDTTIPEGYVVATDVGNLDDESRAEMIDV